MQMKNEADYRDEWKMTPNQYMDWQLENKRVREKLSAMNKVVNLYKKNTVINIK